MSGGINVIGNYIFGLSEDDLTTMQETLGMDLREVRRGTGRSRVARLRPIIA